MGCGSGYLFSGNYYWTRVGLDWRSGEHHRGSLMLCGYSASPEEEGNRSFVLEITKCPFSRLLFKKKKYCFKQTEAKQLPSRPI